MDISGKVPPNWWTLAMPFSDAARGVGKLIAAPPVSITPDEGLWTPDRIRISRFAGAIVAQEAQNLACLHFPRDAVQHVDGTEGFVDAAQGEDGCAFGGHHLPPFFGAQDSAILRKVLCINTAPSSSTPMMRDDQLRSKSV